jgi:SRSO17 transposase
MLERALDAKIPVAWVTGDEVYGGDGRLRRWLEERDLPHVLAVKPSQALWSMRLGQERAAKLAGQLPARAWRHLSAGTGQGPAHLRLGQGADPAAAGARQRALAAGPPPPRRWGAGVLCVLWASPDDLSRAGPGGGTRWIVKGGFQQAKGQTRLDHYQVRRYDAGYRHITLAMVAHAFLAVMRVTTVEAMAAADTGAAEHAEVAELLPLTIAEIRGLGLPPGRRTPGLCGGGRW